MAQNNRRAEALRTVVQMQFRALVDDGFGNPVPGEFETQFTAWANLHPLKGGEGVISARLEGTQPYIITVRYSSETEQVTEGWQIVEKNNPNRIYAISGPPTDPDGKRAWLEILSVLGGRS
jgi:SPP1 family predicted phage head-tail adaptor